MSFDVNERVKFKHIALSTFPLKWGMSILLAPRKVFLKEEGGFQLSGLYRDIRKVPVNRRRVSG